MKKDSNKTVGSQVKGTSFSLVAMILLAVPAMVMADTLWTAGGNGVIYQTNSGSVGVGIISPEAKLHISNSYVTPAGGISADTVAIFSKNNTASGSASIDILTRSSGLGALNFGNQTGETNNGRITYGGQAHPTQSNSMAFTVAGGERMRILDIGKVGIGTTNPGTQLDVRGACDSVALTILDNCGISIVNTDQTLNNLQGIYFRQNNSVGAAVTSGRLSVQNTDHTVGSEDGDMLFMTIANGVLSEKMRILNNGKVGIGTGAPSALLHLFTYDNAISPDNTLLKVYNGAANSGAHSNRIALGSSDTINALITAVTLPSGDARSELQLQTRATTGVLNTGIFLDKSGSVGIGTKTPTQALDISGNVKLSGNIVSDNDICIGVCQ